MILWRFPTALSRVMPLVTRAAPDAIETFAAEVERYSDSRVCR